MLYKLIGARVGALALALLPAATSAPGLRYRFTLTNTVTIPGHGSKTLSGVEGVGQVAGDKARVDFTITSTEGMPPGAGMPMLPQHGYCLLTRGGSTMTIVDPDKHQYVELDVDALVGVAGALTGMLNTTVANVHIDVQNLGDGGTLQGYPTLHYRRTDSYTSRMSVLGVSSTDAVNDTADYWFAPALKDVINPFVRTKRPTLYKDPEFTRQSEAADAKMYHGVPIKMIMRGASETGKHGSVSHTVSMEMTDIVRADVAAPVFEVPSGYTKADPPVREAQGTAAPDSTPRIGAGLVEEVKQETKQSAKDKIKSLIHVP